MNTIAYQHEASQPEAQSFSYTPAEKVILQQAAFIIEERFQRQDSYCSPESVMSYLQCQLAHEEREVFALMLLDNQHRLIRYLPMFYGTIDSASVYPREVVKAALQANAAAVILAHNHPSGVSEPSDSDRRLTDKLVKALALMDIRVLDHIIVGENCCSFAQRGLL